MGSGAAAGVAGSVFATLLLTKEYIHACQTPLPTKLELDMQVDQRFVLHIRLPLPLPAAWQVQRVRGRTAATQSYSYMTLFATLRASAK